jgi:hypothetical protein
MFLRNVGMYIEDHMTLQPEDQHRCGTKSCSQIPLFATRVADCSLCSYVSDVFTASIIRAMQINTIDEVKKNKHEDVCLLGCLAV